MSPLARSLLALAALLATGVAMRYSSNCAEKDIGLPGTPIDTIHTSVPSPGGTVHIDGNVCNATYAETYVCGVHVKACNTNGGNAPNIDTSNLLDITVTCDAPDYCAPDGATVEITPKCCYKY